MAVLSIKGGKPVREKAFPGWPVYNEREIELTREVIQSGKWWRGSYDTAELGEGKAAGKSKAEEFEERFAHFHQTSYAVATSSGSGALEIAVKASGIKPGDEVIVPPYTFIATATAVLQNNAVPIFADINADTYCLDPEKVEEAITEKTRAIIPVHFGGHFADMDRIMEIARKYNLKVIEDAAHAHGCSWKGRMAGSIGDIGMFSFQQSKAMTSGEGGIIITNDEQNAKLCFSLHHCGREEGRPWYEHHRLGWNYRMSELHAAVLLAQIERLEEQNEKRMKNAEYLSRGLSGIEGISPLKVDSRMTKHSFYLYIMRYDCKRFAGISRERFIEAMNAEGIPCISGYSFALYENPIFLNQSFHNSQCPLDCPRYGKQTNYLEFKDRCPVSEKAVREEAVWLTHNLLLGSQEDIDDIIEAVRKIRKNVDELR